MAKKEKRKSQTKKNAEPKEIVEVPEIRHERKKFVYLHKHHKKMLFGVLALVIVLIIGVVLFIGTLNDSKSKVKSYTAYLASDTPTVELLDAEGNVLENTSRGQEIKVFDEISLDNRVRIELNGKEYFIHGSKMTKNKENIVQETVLYVRTSATLYEDADSSKITGFIKKGEGLEIIGYDKVQEDGKVSKYKIKHKNQEGYIREKYLVYTETEAKAIYDPEGTHLRHLKMGSSLGGGNAATLDYFPVEKPKFADNVIPDEVRALYLNSAAIRNVDKYIEFAKKNNINAFVVDIKDNTSPAYASFVMKEYSPTNYKRAFSTFENYQKYIQKLKDNGFYVIGRITVFKDSYYIQDHPEHAIMDTKTKKPFSHNGSYWPSAYQREVWEFNVELAKEAVTEMGFNEIQFDYVRFPDRTLTIERKGLINFNNKYQESKAEAIQTFLMYAADEIHDVGAYISVDVFGESANNYVTGYGQYWAAITNVVDVISGMPYPDHFNRYEYGFKKVVWTIPYDLLKKWGESVVEKQALAPTPAIVRTWIQAYDTGKSPAVKYDATKISDQIRGLYANGLTGGYMTWNSGSNLAKYEQIKEAFRKDYIK